MAKTVDQCPYGGTNIMRGKSKRFYKKRTNKMMRREAKLNPESARTSVRQMLGGYAD